MSAKQKRLRWEAVSQHALRVTRGDRVLGVFVMQTGRTWSVGAVETARDADSPIAVFGDHAHALIGEYDTPGEAFGRAEAYAVVWRDQSDATLPACDCDEIGSAAP